MLQVGKNLPKALLLNLPLVIVACALFVLNQYREEVLVEKIQESSKEISKAIQISFYS